jgi:hypothetical protein
VIPPLNMVGDNLVRLIERRHEGPGWQVFTELANGTGARARRRADAVAMGMWPSRGYEIHGYECKISRGDVRKELQDVTKMDAVGKYCDFWWLTVSDPAIMDGLLVPESWGVLAPRARVLRIVRPAKKRKTVPVDRSFVAAMLRSVTDHWVPRSKHQEVVSVLERVVLRQDAEFGDPHAGGGPTRNHRAYEERAFGADDTKRELERLRKQVVEFEQASGVQIANGWRMGEVGQAVQNLVGIMRAADPGNLLRKAELMKRGADMHADYVKDARRHAEMIEDLVAEFQPACAVPQNEP